jgi:CubicO group peptidase (beta-lactamase class C family)
VGIALLAISLLVSACLTVALATTSATPDTISARAEIAAIERSIDVGRLMKEHGLPGMSVAVVRNFRLAWAKGYGRSELGGTRPVTPRTLFLAGSISKPVTAVGALALVDAGKLSLTDDVNDKLTSWHIPRNGYTSQKVTLARLLDHTAGFTGGEFFPGYTVDEPLPTLPQVLDGRKPARNPPVRVGYVPGSRWQYSGDGYLVVQQLMMDATGEPFPRLMRALVFDKLGMRSSTFEQPLPHGPDSLAACGTRASGAPVPGRWHVSPEAAACGLWTTPSDLATLAIALARAARGDRPSPLLSHRLAADMLAPHFKEGVVNILGTPDDPDAMGYGFFVGRTTHRFGHIGGHVGYQATLVFFGDTGNGVVVMTNSDVGLQAGNQLLNAIANYYRWNYAAPGPP